MLANILDGIMNAISMGSLLANLMGVTLGIIFGALPGLTAAMGVALLIPLTFGMPAVEAFSALLGMYVGAIYGGCITAILIGTLIGIIPATGVSAASFLAYSEAKRFSKTPEMYGKGCVEGIAATESSNNAVCGGALIPLLTLGVPGDIITAIMLGALMIQGLTPGPLLFVEHPVTVYGIFAAFIIANIMMLVCGLIAVRGAGKIIAIPGAVLMPIVITLCVVGGYAVNNSTFDLLVVAIFGTVGYLMIKCDFPQPPLLLAMILEPIAEANFRRALTISQNDYSIFYTSPVACIILLVSLLVLLKPIYDDFRAGRKAAA